MRNKFRNTQVEIVKALSQNGSMRITEMVDFIYKEKSIAYPHQSVMTALNSLLRRKTVVRVSRGVYNLA